MWKLTASIWLCSLVTCTMRLSFLRRVRTATQHTISSLQTMSRLVTLLNYGRRRFTTEGLSARRKAVNVKIYLLHNTSKPVTECWRHKVESIRLYSLKWHESSLLNYSPAFALFVQFTLRNMPAAYLVSTALHNCEVCDILKACMYYTSYRTRFRQLEPSILHQVKLNVSY